MAKTIGSETETALGSSEGTPAAVTSVSLVGGGEIAERVAALLEEQGLAVERRASTAQVLARVERPALIVVCVSGPLAAAVKTTLEPLRRAAPEANLVVVCEEIRPGEIRRSLNGGVSGVVLVRQLATALGPCLAAARAGQVCLPRPFARQVEPAALSMREKQILGMVVRGYVNSQIAERLFIAESTVKSHLSSAFAKLGVSSRNEAVDLLLDVDRGVGRTVLRPDFAEQTEERR